MRIGRWTTIAATALAIVLSPIFAHYDAIFKGLTVLISYIAPPITAVFLVGVFWKQAAGRAAFLTMIAGGLIGALCFFLDFFKQTVVGAEATPESIAASPVLHFIYDLALKDFMLASFGIFGLCVIIQVIASLVSIASGSPIWPQHCAKGCLLPQGQASNTLKILLVVVGCMALAE